MILLARYMRPMGFKHSGMFDDSASYGLYYKSLPECRAVLVVHNEAAPSSRFTCCILPLTNWMACLH